MIYDSPLQNATAHFLQNMLYVAGPSPDETAEPAAVYGENYRAGDIESADTQYIRVTTASGVRIISIASHSAREKFGPTAGYRLEGGRVAWDGSGRTEVFERRGGTERLVDRWDNGPDPIKELVFIRTLEALREGRPPLCTAGNSRQHTLCIESSFASSGGPVPVDPRWTGRIVPAVDDYQIVIPGLEDLMRRMYDDGSGYAGAGAPWAVPSREIEL